MVFIFAVIICFVLILFAILKKEMRDTELRLLILIQASNDVHSANLEQIINLNRQCHSVDANKRKNEEDKNDDQP